MLTTLGIVKSYEIKTIRNQAPKFVIDKNMGKAQRLNGGGVE
jgi:hypothetical protein